MPRTPQNPEERRFGRRDRVDLGPRRGEVLHESEYGVELGLQAGNFLVADGNTRQMRNAPDGRLIDGHGLSAGMMLGRDGLASARPPAQSADQIVNATPAFGTSTFVLAPSSAATKSSGFPLSMSKVA